MPRQARIDIAGSLHHIICRGIERREIFLDDVDRDNFVSRLVEITTITSTRCFAWALMPNHVHLLLQTGIIPIATLMQKLLAGYATTFNLRHTRHGYLFQNRYKSILCQEETYLLELVRYIHLNPLRAGIVHSLDSLAHYRYSGHSCILGTNAELDSWMPIKDILERFGSNKKQSRIAYQAFVGDGVAKGHRPDLTGGGLLRSAGGWRELHSAKEAGVFLKGDERILGDSDFVESALSAAEDDFEKKSRYRLDNVDLNKVVQVVAKILNLEPGDVCVAGKQPQHVRARSLLCFWAVRELGMTETALAKVLGITQPAVAQSVARGSVWPQKMAGVCRLSWDNENLIFLYPSPWCGEGLLSRWKYDHRLRLGQTS